MIDTVEKIINTAENMIREGGYHAFSFRQIADQLEIKSASIHYHFPNKEALGTSVTERYTADFFTLLEDSTDIEKYVKIFQSSLEGNKRACLCGILAAEAGKLPESMLEALRDFTKKNLDWLKISIAKKNPSLSDAEREERAYIIFSALEGAMTFSAMTKQSAHLDQVAASVLKMFS